MASHRINASGALKPKVARTDSTGTVHIAAVNVSPLGVTHSSEEDF